MKTYNHAAINAAVAEKVMGWKWCDKLCCWVHGPTLADTTSRRDFKPSTDAAHAKLVLLWLREQWGCASLVVGLQWHCYRFNDDVANMGSADTPELAICLAALKAVGDDITKYEETSK